MGGLDYIEKYVKKAMSATSGAELIEIRIEERKTLRIQYTGKEIEEISQSVSLGGCVRAKCYGGWGFSSFNNLSDLRENVNNAINDAKALNIEGAKLPPVEIGDTSVDLTTKDNPAEIPLRDKVILSEKYNSIILSSRGVRTSVVQYRDTEEERLYFNSEGAVRRCKNSFCGMSLAAVAVDGAVVQRAHHSVGNLRGYKTVLNLEEKAEDVARRAVSLLNASRVKAGIYTILIDPLLSGVFVHEAFGHLSESDFLYENERLREILKPGRRFGPDILNIVDDPTLDREAGSIVFDDEGTISKKNHLIKQGILTSRLHSRETAAKMNEQPTGNARAISYHFAPIVRMTNTYIESGDASFEDMLASIDKGLYVKGALGGMTNCEMFTFSAGEAFEITDGKIGKQIRDVVLTGNVFETLKNIERIGNDLELHGGLGGCGKESQSPLRVGTGGPHVKINKVIIGGE